MITPVMKTYKVQNKLNYVFFTNLVTFFEIIEEESCVSHVKDYPLHGMSQFCQDPLVFSYRETFFSLDQK